MLIALDFSDVEFGRLIPGIPKYPRQPPAPPVPSPAPTPTGGQMVVVSLSEPPVEIYLLQGEKQTTIHCRSLADKPRRIAKGLVLKSFNSGTMLRGTSMPSTSIVSRLVIRLFTVTALEQMADVFSSVL